MATGTPPQDQLRSLRQKIEGIRAATQDTHLVYRQTFEKVMSAADDCLQTLTRSALEQAKTALRDSLALAVEELAASSARAQTEIESFKTLFEGVLLEPSEQSDRCGLSMSLAVERCLCLVQFREGPISLARRLGVEVSNAAKLDEHIAHWQAVKANLVDCWPWTNSPLPPVDRGMVARSRAAFQAGEQAEDIDALIERLRSE